MNDIIFVTAGLGALALLALYARAWPASEARPQ